MSFIKEFIPKKMKKTLKGIFSKQKKRSSELKQCSVCSRATSISAFPYKRYFQKWYENGFDYSPFKFETLNLKHYECSNCGANDRDRLIALYFNQYLSDRDNKSFRLIDFAPVKALQSLLKAKKNVLYRSADLYKEDVDDKVDITNMTLYQDESFDIFICSHILEHIENDLDAMNELFRITKQNGIGLCLVPIMLSLDKSVENTEYLENVDLRWKYFGQNDHVRMYAKKDFVSRLESVGFKVEQCGQDFFGKDVFNQYGLDHKSVLYVVKKETY